VAEIGAGGGRHGGGTWGIGRNPARQCHW
jgi:hypothetical protein